MKDCNIHVEVMTVPKSRDSTSLTAHDPIPPYADTAVIPDSIEVTGLIPSADESLITDYFESTKSGGARGIVLECKLVGSGVARLKFRSPEGNCNDHP